MFKRVIFLFLGLAAVVVGQEKSKPKQPAARVRPVNPSFASIVDQEGLPRVRLIGDSISMGYTLPVREILKGKANVHRPKANCGPTSRGLESLDSWLGDQKWDVIHFNFGLHDMVYFTEDGKNRAELTDVGARPQVPLNQYEKNLRQIVEKLNKTGAKLIWCTTTPVPAGSAGRKSDDSLAYNEVANRIMRENQIQIDDLHAFARPQLKVIQLPKNVHFTPEGSRVLAKQVAESILATLKK